MSVQVVKDGRTSVFAIRTDTPLGVGSAFKLYVLQALKARIAGGSANWDDIVRLTPEYRSLVAPLVGWTLC